MCPQEAAEASPENSAPSSVRRPHQRSGGSPPQHKHKRHRLTHNHNQKHNHKNKNDQKDRHHKDHQNDHRHQKETLTADPLHGAPAPRDAELAATTLLPVAALAATPAPLEARLAAMATPALCSIAQAARRSLLALAVESAAVPEDAPAAALHDQDPARSHLRRLLLQAEPIRICGACFTSIRRRIKDQTEWSGNPKNRPAPDKRIRRSSNQDSLRMLNREYKRTIESVAQAVIIVGLASGLSQHAPSSQPSLPSSLHAISPSAPKTTIHDHAEPSLYSKPHDNTGAQIDSSHPQPTLRQLLTSLINLLLIVVSDHSGSVISADVVNILLEPSNEGELGHVIAPILRAAFVDAMQQRDIMLAIPSARLIAMWIHKRIMSISDASKALDFAISEIKATSVLSIHANDIAILRALLAIVFQSIKVRESIKPHDTTHVAEMYLALVGRIFPGSWSTSSSTLSDATVLLLFDALDTISLLVEREKSLRPFVLKTPEDRSRLTMLLVSAVDRLDILLPKISPLTGDDNVTSTLDLVRVICQIFVLCGSIERRCSLSAPKSLELQILSTVNRVFVLISRAPWIMAQHSLADATDPVVIKVAQRCMIRLCHPSLLRCLVDVAPFEITSSATTSPVTVDPNNRELAVTGPETTTSFIEQGIQAIICEGLLQSLIQAFLITQESQYISAYAKNVSLVSMGYKLLRYIYNLSVTEALTNQFSRLDPALCALFVFSLGQVVHNSIVAKEGGFGTFSSVHGRFDGTTDLRFDVFDITCGIEQHDPSEFDQETTDDHERSEIAYQRFVDTTMQVLSVFLARPVSRLALVDAGILGYFVCMQYVRKVLSDADESQMQAFQKVLEFISRSARDSSVRFKLKTESFGRRGMYNENIPNATSTAISTRTDTSESGGGGGSSSSGVPGLALAHPSPNGVVAFMAALAIGSEYRLRSSSPYLASHQAAYISGQNPRFLSAILSHAIRFIHQHFGHDRSVMIALSRASLTDTLLPPAVMVQTGLCKISNKTSISLIECLLCNIDPEHATSSQEMDDVDAVNSVHDTSSSSFLDDTAIADMPLSDIKSNGIADLQESGRSNEFDLNTSDRDNAVPMQMSADIKRDVVHLLDALLRSNESLSEILRISSAVKVPEWMHQHQPVGRIVRVMVTCTDTVVQEVLARIVRRMFHMPPLVREMVSLCGYSLVMETLMECADVPEARSAAESAMDMLLGTATPIVQAGALVQGQTHSAVRTASSVVAISTHDQQQLDVALALASRTLQYAEQSTVTFQSLSIRDRARVAVCYLGTDRLLGLRARSISTMPFTSTSVGSVSGDVVGAPSSLSAPLSHLHREAADAFTLPSIDAIALLECMFSAVVLKSDQTSDHSGSVVVADDIDGVKPGLDFAGDNKTQSGSKNQDGSDNNNDDCGDSSGGSTQLSEESDNTTTTSVGRWTKERIVHALRFLGWRYQRHVEPFGIDFASTMSTGVRSVTQHRPTLFLNLLACERQNPGSSDRMVAFPSGSPDAVTLVFSDKSEPLVCDGRLLTRSSCVFDVMLSGPFQEHASRCVSLEIAGRGIWTRILAYFALEHEQRDRDPTHAFDDHVADVATEPCAEFCIDDLNTVELMFECANQYLSMGLRHACIEWMALAAARVAQVPSWSHAQQLHIWRHRHPNLQYDIPESLFEKLRLCTLQALLASVMDHNSFFD